MWSIALLFVQGAALAQPSWPTPYAVLRAEHARGADMITLRAALQSTDTVVQRLAVRAIGRTERERYIADLAPLLESPAVSVRREAVLAGAQMKVLGFGLELVAGRPADRSPDVRGTVYAALGRTAPASADWETTIANGLRDTSLLVRQGAARGLEAFYRRHRRTFTISDSVAILLESLTNERSEWEFTRLAVMARLHGLAAAKSGMRAPPPTWPGALRAHGDPEVRRLITGAFPGFFVRDTSALVRFEQVRGAEFLDRLGTLLADTSEHVHLAAIDRLASEQYQRDQVSSMLESQLTAPRNWRTRAHATLALARIDAVKSAPHIVSLAHDSVWQARAWAARAAMIVRDEETLATLARDVNPNVRLEAISTLDDALRALEIDHAGLLLAAAEFLDKQRGDAATTTRIVNAGTRALERISRTQSVRWRDPRVALLSLLAKHRETNPSVGGLWMAQWLRDADPEIQRIAIAALPEWHPQASAASGAVPFTPSPYVPPPFASETELDSLRGATVEIRMRGKGVMVFDLLEEVAPMTVVTFARLAARGDFNGRTIHRVVPNFVLQGGSPGADEYDPATDFFMRDEVGAPNIRGSIGISTRGRDTGDGQIYFNLVDNVRLDFDYTVFANPLSGMAVMDSIQEGDVIESVTIRRVSRGGAR